MQRHLSIGRNERNWPSVCDLLAGSHIAPTHDSSVKEKYGSDAEEGDDDDEDSEEGESEDEDGEELTPAVDVAILRTLARIKRKDPSIYQQGKDVFEGAYA